VWGVHEIDHIIPPVKGGTEEEINLCLACRECNLYKAQNILAIDPLTGEQVALFHPWEQPWNDHFCWEESLTRIAGITPIGRATIALLNMNSVNKVTVRQF
jgi:hypothetical protein